jgi:DNA-directed RNA polymerase subunit RPC12/RpoP
MKEEIVLAKQTRQCEVCRRLVHPVFGARLCLRCWLLANPEQCPPRPCGTTEPADDDPIAAAARDKVLAGMEGAPPPAEQRERARQVREVGFAGLYTGRSGHHAVWYAPWYHIGPDGEPIPVRRPGTIIRCADCGVEVETLRPDQAERCPACRARRVKRLAREFEWLRRRRAIPAGQAAARAYGATFRERQRLG